MLLPIRYQPARRWLSILLLLLAITLLYTLRDTSKLHSRLHSPLPSPSPPDPPTVHLILAAMTLNPHRWTEHLTIPNLTVIPYIADNPNARYHPPANKGNEAISYLTYMHDFYNQLRTSHPCTSIPYIPIIFPGLSPNSQL